MKAKSKKDPTWDEIGKAIGTKMEEGCEGKEKKSWFAKGSCSSSGSGGAIYGLGFIGALVYFVTTAPDIWVAIIGVVKAIFWPGIIVYGVLKFFGM